MIPGAPSALLALGALSSVVIALFLLRAMPRAGFALWTAVMFLVPVWVGVALGIIWPAILALTVAMLVANVHRIELLAGDVLMAVFVVMLLGLHVLGRVGLGETVVGVIEWAVPYAWGRVVLARVDVRWVSTAITLCACVAALLAIVEFATTWNPFILIPGQEPLYSSWNTLQERGGIVRVEGAFGHSIALGAALAVSTAFAVAAPWRTAPKLLAVGLLGAATVLTFSRTGIVTMVITLVLAVWLLPSLTRRFKIIVTAVGLVGGLVALPIVSSVLDAAGREAEGSAGYRTDLLVLLGQVDLLGNAGPWQSLVSGDFYLGYFARSIDNALMLALLRYGVVPTAVVLAVIVSAAALALRRESRSPAAIAVLGQLPSLVVVALITQYGALLWFTVGLALSWHGRSHDGEGRGPATERGATATSRPVRPLTSGIAGGRVGSQNIEGGEAWRSRG